ncbi:MAG: hypothetical protein KAS71_01015 [Bacteroidales bacterium]|nr:hypothetical protein [Bacteroidales bacterium]
MENKMGKIGGLIIASVIIWGAVIIGCASALKGTDCYDIIQNILVGGVLSHIILIWGSMALLFKKIENNKAEDEMN